MTDGLKLAKCPFCGGIAEMKVYGYAVCHNFSYQVRCRECWGTSAVYPTKRQAAHWWNKRGGSVTVRAVEEAAT